MERNLGYYNDEGNLNILYQNEFETESLGDNILVVKENDKKAKLDNLTKKQLLNSLRKKKKRGTRKKTEDNEYPIKSEIIKLSRKEDKEKEEEKKEINEKPRKQNIFKKDPDENLFNEELKKNYSNQEEYNKVMLLNEINKRHPRKINKKGKPLKYNICDNFGFFGNNPLCLFNDFSKFGEGLSDYFRLLKINIIYFFLCFIFTLLIFIYCGEDIKKSKKDIKVVFGYSKVKDFLMRYTLSNILINNYNIYDIISIKGKEIKYTFSCPTSIIDNKKYQVYKNSISKCLFFYDNVNIDYIKSKFSNLINYQRYERIKFEGNDLVWENLTGIRESTICEKDFNSCSIDFSKYNELIQPKHSINDIELAFFQYQCVYNHNEENSKKNQKIFLAFSLMIMIITIIYIYLLFIFHWYSYIIHNENQYQINQYTVLIKGIEINGEKPLIYKELNELVKAITNSTLFNQNNPNNIIKDNNDVESDSINNYEIIYPIYQISYCPYNSNLLYLNKKKWDLLEKVEEPFYELNNKPLWDISLNKRIFNFNGKTKQKKKIESFEYYIEKAERNPKKNIKDIYITFKSKKHAEKCYNCYNSKNWFYRIITYLLKGKETLNSFYFKDQWLDIEYIPSQCDGLKFENFKYDIYTKFFLNLFTSFIIFLIILTSLIIYFFSVSFLKKFNETYNNHLNCNKFIEDYNNVMTYNILYNEFYDNDNKKQYNLFCICKYYYVTKGKDYAKNFYLILDDSGIYDDYSYKGNLYVYPCKDWINKMDITSSVYILNYFVIFIFNIFTLKIIPIVVKLEKKKTIMEERASVFKKVFISSLFINCLSPIITNIYLNSKSFEKNKKLGKYFPILNGEQITFNSKWYYYVSTTITINLILGIFVPYIIDFIKWSFKFCFRKCCYRNLHLQKDKYKFLYWFIGPEFRIEVKLGFQLSLFCSCLISGFFITNPISIFIMLLLTFISFYLDKILFLYYCKTPINYNQKINKLYMQILYIFIMISFLIHGYYIGLFYLHIPDVLSIKQQIIIMIKNPLIITFIIISVALLIIPFFYFNLLPTFIFCCCKCGNTSYGFATDDNFEVNSMKDLTIYEVLPLSILYKNYYIRKLEYNQIMKYSKDYNLNTLLSYYKQRLKADKIAISTKLEYITGDICPINDKFDNEVKYIMEEINEDDLTKIQDNYSYNIFYNKCYRQQYLKEFNIDLNE